MSVQLFGILNYTNDSFYDGGKNDTLEAALDAALQLLNEGAQYIDVGAEATNPFVKPISAQEEIARLEDLLPRLIEQFPDQISLDTYHPETLKWALQFGKPILNDVSGLHNPEMVKLAVTHGLTCIVGHLPPDSDGIPVNSHQVKMDDFNEVVVQILTRVPDLRSAGLREEQVILDPNVGFGKTMRLNWQLVKEFANAVSYPVMIGFSHKRFLGYDELGNTLPNNEEQRHTKEVNVSAAQLASTSGASYLRVHEPVWYKGIGL